MARADVGAGLTQTMPRSVQRMQVLNDGLAKLMRIVMNKVYPRFT